MLGGFWGLWLSAVGYVPVSSPVPMVWGGAESRDEEGLSHQTKPGYRLVWEESPLYPVSRNPSWMP